jgi:hypothetical protein
LIGEKHTNHNLHDLGQTGFGGPRKLFGDLYKAL